MPKIRKIKLSKFGRITGPGEYPILGVGIVELTQDDIEKLKSIVGNPTVELLSTESVQIRNYWRLNLIEPN